MSNSLLVNVCNKYRANSDKAIFLDNVVVVPVDKADLYIVLDKKYHILGIDKFSDKNEDAIKDYFDSKYKMDDEDEDKMCLDLMSDSFTYYSLGMIQSIYDKIYFSDKYCFFKGKLINERDFKELLSYFSFIGKEIKYYSQVNLCMQRLGYDVPDISTYLNSIMEELDYYIDYCISLNKRPFECDFISAIGQSNLCINPNIINNIFNYTLREKGYEIDYDNNCLKKIEKENDLDISDISKKLIKLMD